MEGWHNKINRAAGKAHPNIFELVELFKTGEYRGVSGAVGSRWGSGKHKEVATTQTEETCESRRKV